MRPGWARTCTCGATPFGYFCSDCVAWAGAMPAEGAAHNEPRVELDFRSGVEQLVARQSHALEVAGSSPASAPDGVRCKNGRYARPARDGERLLPCGCPMAGAPRECVDAVAVLTKDVSYSHGTGH